MVAIADDVMQFAIGKLEELQSISVSVALKPFGTQNWILECHRER